MESHLKIAVALLALKDLSNDERKEVFSYFCKECGKDDPYCQCWGDD